MGFQGGALRGGEEGEGECCVGVQRKPVDGGGGCSCIQRGDWEGYDIKILGRRVKHLD